MHAHAMCEALERKGAQPLLFYAPDFPERLGLTIIPEERGPVLASSEKARVEFGADCTSVWLRRPYFAKTPEDFEEGDRAAIERECRDMRLSFFDLLCPSALWVNTLRSSFTEGCKPTQLVAAQRCGLKIPRSLISNDPAEILAFVQAAHGPVVYKTFNALVPTTLVTPDLLSDPEILRWTPGIYQHCVEKEHELRVTVVGRRLFVVRINSQQTVRGKVDWREAIWKPRGQAGDLTFDLAVLPAPIKQACLRLMRSLGLAYGAIDLIVTPENEYVFLEVNPSGQFLWVDHEVGIPVLDALSEMLIQGRLDYNWNPRSPGVRVDSAFQKAVEARQLQSMAEHVCDLQL